MSKKLNLSYLSDTDKMMVDCGFITMILTSTLMDATVVKKCYKRYERLEHIKKLSPTDRERYYQRVSEELFTI